MLTKLSKILIVKPYFCKKLKITYNNLEYINEVYVYFSYFIKEIWGISFSNNDNFSKTCMGHILHKNSLDKKSVQHLKKS